MVTRQSWHGIRWVTARTFAVVFKLGNRRSYVQNQQGMQLKRLTGAHERDSNLSMKYEYEAGTVIEASAEPPGNKNLYRVLICSQVV
jgi:hypothetical protein